MPGAGPYRAMHATPTAGEFFLAKFFPSDPFTCIFCKPLTSFAVSGVASTDSCVGPQNKFGHPAQRYRQLMQVPVLSARGI